MKLLLDVGNSRIKWVTEVDGELRDADELVHDSEPAASIAVLLDRCLSNPDRVLASNVAGDVFGAELARAVESRWGVKVEFAESQAAAGSVRNAYLDPRQLGVDRWLAILAAANRYRKAVCIVDAGTAVTIDQVDDRGHHLGGIIIPGLDLMRRALTGRTGDLQRLVAAETAAGAAEPTLLGRSTDAAISGGAMAAIRSLIEECAASARSRSGEAVLVVTGGDAERIISHLRRPAEHRPLLVLEGLAVYVPQ